MVVHTRVRELSEALKQLGPLSVHTDEGSTAESLGKN